MKRGGSLSFLVGTIGNVLVMEIGFTDVGSGGYILVSCAHSNTSFISEDSEKAETFNQYFARQMSISNNITDLYTLPPFSYITDERLGSVDVNEADVLKYLRHVNYINLMVRTEYRITSSNSVLTLYISRLQSYLILH